MKKILLLLIAVVFINSSVFTFLLINKSVKATDTQSNKLEDSSFSIIEETTNDILDILVETSTPEEEIIKDHNSSSDIAKESENPSIATKPEELKNQEQTESSILRYELYSDEIIASYFNMKTLQEQYGDTLSDQVYLDESVVSYTDLRYLNVLHLGYDGDIHQGEIIVNAKIADEVLAIFRELYDIGYPIEKMRVISYYGGSDEASMADNNTSGFNFRTMTTGESLSKHAYGLAIDLNPVVNPYIKSGVVLPSNGALYVDRNKEELGMIKQDDVVYQIFKRYGWTWGGDWNSPKDYQHFEKN